MDAREAAAGSVAAARLDEESGQVVYGLHEYDQLTFAYDKVFGPGASQEAVYTQTARPIVEDVLAGYNGTVFAYGQTGSGKTHTMEGPDIASPELKGIIPRMVEDIFDAILDADAKYEFTVRVSYFEIYLERLRDLLNPAGADLAIRQDVRRGVYVEGLTEVYVSSVDEVMAIMAEGASNRAVGATQMNAQSSRSHSLLTIEVAAKDTVSLASSTGKLTLIDLAGSEKVSKTGAEGTTFTEAKNINLSLTTLGLVINALTDPSASHIPYRNSKLTRVLSESLGGNAKTTLIINCSLASFNADETLSTLRFGSRAKRIQNKVSLNVERAPAELEAIIKEQTAIIERLQARLAGCVCGSAVVGADKKGESEPEREGIPALAPSLAPTLAPSTAAPQSVVVAEATEASAADESVTDDDGAADQVAMLLDEIERLQTENTRLSETQDALLSLLDEQVAGEGVATVQAAPDTIVSHVRNTDKVVAGDEPVAPEPDASTAASDAARLADAEALSAAKLAAVELKAEKDTLLALKTELEDEVVAMHEALAALNEQLAAAEGKNDEFTAQREALIQRLAEAEGSAARAAAELCESRADAAELAQLSADNEDELRKELQAAQTERDVASEQATALAAEVKALENEISETTARYETVLGAEQQEVVARMTGLETKIQQLSAANLKLLGELNKLKDVGLGWKTKMLAQQERMEQVEEQLLRLQREYALQAQEYEAQLAALGRGRSRNIAKPIRGGGGKARPAPPASSSPAAASPGAAIQPSPRFVVKSGRPTAKRSFLGRLFGIGSSSKGGAAASPRPSVSPASPAQSAPVLAPATRPQRGSTPRRNSQSSRSASVAGRGRADSPSVDQLLGCE
ncbi:uncharacterized protein AMSG_04425 [Thecamonas trahens ATCC 50062]|uniref:Kinesin-like protein n=1 Tax=Thecamonas trahens ATCC 50062 TaxID=461836 RepID=A0A0L0D803_THETB|nr:hypothetical protein AMSG_04425 [Thecamonas trahens ATCC 50062]KNC48196.1 hypothetical protein AMSG_04425 [Thecamonas trahens ATCC 50062]|eukprot:XP_013758765.1 hypothetical protein AMSG_04425 [Thecamonas trahens ATCC 50062]